MVFKFCLSQKTFHKTNILNIEKQTRTFCFGMIISLSKLVCFLFHIAIIKQILKTALHLFVHQGYHGAYMSFITKKGVKAFKVKGVVKGLSNVLIASQWVMAPGGLPVAAAAGKFAVQRILKVEKREMRL